MNEQIISDEILIAELKSRISSYKSTLFQLEELTSELKDVNKKLAESEKIKTNFIANIANEIVNPFASIIGLSKNLANSKNLDENKMKMMVITIFNEAVNLDFQLKNIFAAAEIEAGESYPDFSRVNINKIINNQINSYKLSNSDKINITYNSTPQEINFITDAPKISLIFSNIFSNAVKFAKESGFVNIESKFEDKTLTLNVENDGDIISEEEKNKIFDRFQQGENVGIAQKGHGLGLAIVKNYIDLLEGSIKIESSEKTTKFIITIPEYKYPIENFSTLGNNVFFDENVIF